MLTSIGIGLVLVAITVVMHGVGTTCWIRFVRFELKGEHGLSFRASLVTLVATALALLALHVLEILLWAGVYSRLPGVEGVGTAEEAIYFSLVTFTTLGYGDITLEPPYRLLSGIEAMNGILLVGWSSALFFAVVQRVWSGHATRPVTRQKSRAQ